MRHGPISLALLSVFLSAMAQIALKAGMTSATIQAAIATASPPRVILAVSQSWLVLGGMFAFGLSALVWLAVLSRVPLSAAYPFVALGIVVTTTAGFLLFGEAVSAVKVAGVALIIMGVILVAYSL